MGGNCEIRREFRHEIFSACKYGHFSRFLIKVDNILGWDSATPSLFMNNDVEEPFAFLFFEEICYILEFISLESIAPEIQ